MSRQLQAAGRVLPAPVMRAVSFARRALSFVVVRPESERIIAQLSDPMVESVAYLNRAIRDMQATLEAALELHDRTGLLLDERLLEVPFVFHSLGRVVQEKASVLAVVRAGSSLPRSMQALGYEVKVTPTPQAALIDGGQAFDVIVAIAVPIDASGFQVLRSCAKAGASLFLTVHGSEGPEALGSLMQGWNAQTVQRVDSADGGGRTVTLVTATAA